MTTWPLSTTTIISSTNTKTTIIYIKSHYNNHYHISTILSIAHLKSHKPQTRHITHILILSQWPLHNVFIQINFTDHITYIYIIHITLYYILYIYYLLYIILHYIYIYITHTKLNVTGYKMVTSRRPEWYNNVITYLWRFLPCDEPAWTLRAWDSWSSVTMVMSRQ